MADLNSSWGSKFPLMGLIIPFHEAQNSPSWGSKFPFAAMPFRALTGYFFGQVSVTIFTNASSAGALRKELAVKAENNALADDNIQCRKSCILPW